MASGEFLSQSVSFFDQRNPTQQSSLLHLQVDPSAPTPSGMVGVTGAVLPDVSLARRTSHFPSDLYDLRPESHLSRFLQALLGESGVGQLRKRQQVARYQSAMGSTHFYDLDAFYGALFGATRTPREYLPINPYTDTATPDEWDDIHSRDALYRERLSRLSKAIPMAGTVPGLIAAAEAVLGEEFDLYEGWRILDMDQVAPVAPAPPAVPMPRTWQEVFEDYPTYGSMETDSYAEISDEDGMQRGGPPPVPPPPQELIDRSSFILRPKKSYESLSSDPTEVARLKASDAHDLRRVISVLKPANARLSVSTEGVAVHIPTRISRVVADSNFWQVIPRVTPREPMAPYRDLRTLGAVAGRAVASGVMPLPPFHSQQTQQAIYNADVVSVSSYTLDLNGRVVESQSFDTVNTFSGESVSYGPEKAMLDARRALAARGASSGVMSSHVYSGERLPVGSAT